MIDYFSFLIAMACVAFATACFVSPMFFHIGKLHGRDEELNRINKCFSVDEEQ